MITKKTTFGITGIALLLILLSVSGAWAHCEIPCGIYDDHMRIHLIEEDAATIEKAMKQIAKLGGGTHRNYNQLVRWITNKEVHASRIQETVCQYFMAQRIKAGDDNYREKLVLLHQILVVAMECKQTIDLSNVQELLSVLKSFEKLYFGQTQGD